VQKPTWKLEAVLWQLGYHLVAGVDEAGRGALAGPVVAAVVVLPKKAWSFRDSKILTLQKCEDLAVLIKKEALAWGVGLAEADEVDKINILRATHLAAYRALSQMSLQITALVTDFLKLENYPYLAVPKGDSRSFQVAAASILAKTTRDQLMLDYAKVYPHYGFEHHKGYGSSQHLQALDCFGPCTLHRKSYKPVAQRRLFQP
jgi:ribonuclease HII